MKCHICYSEKLRREFPRETLSLECEHPPLFCLRCAVGAARTLVCPYSDCKQPVDPSKIELCEQRLQFLFPEIDSLFQHRNDAESTECEVFIASMDGERTEFAYPPNLNVISLKEQISVKMKVESSKQKLMFQDKQLEIYSKNGQFNKLSDYGIHRGATIHLIVLLYAIPEHMDHVIFDLSWSYPSTGRDFLDASCIIYSHLSHKGTVNYDKKSWPQQVAAVQHSGDGMDDSSRRGYHTIDISLKKVPQNVTHLFFTLSVWSNPSMVHFPSPILRFYDASNTGKDLCNTSLSHTTDSEAVVMCYVSRSGTNNQWEIFEAGHLSDGSAVNYEPLYDAVTAIISGRLAAKHRRATVKSLAVAPSSTVQSGATSSGPRIVEMVFCFDTTGSMYNCIEEVKKKVKETISKLLRDMPNLRISVFAHGDHDCPRPYVTKYIDFSKDVQKLCSFVTNVERTPGGGAECYEFALYEIKRKLSWSKGSNKSVVMIGDAYPHLVGDPVNKFNVDWKTEAKSLFKDKGVRIYAVQCQTGMTGPVSNGFWKDLAILGHGKHLLLKNFNAIVDLLLAICYREGAPSLLRKFESEVRKRGPVADSVSSMFN